MEQQITVVCRQEQIYRNANNEVFIRMNAEEFDSGQIELPIQQRCRSPKLSVYGESLSRILTSEGRHRTAEAYRCAIRSFRRFLNGEDIRLSQINREMMRNYQECLLVSGKSMNTISFYLRNLRSIYNKALLEKRFNATQNPFKNLHTGVYETKKRALKREEMQQLAALPTSKLSKTEHYSLLFFLFCFHARGMSFVDLAYLRKSALQGKRLIYRRRKTGRLLSVGINREMLSILAYFSESTSNSPFLFPILNPEKKVSEYRQYQNALRIQNLQLKILSRKSGLSGSLSTHVSRHSWATLAKREGVSLSVISEALGHRDERTTSIYLDSFEESMMDRVSWRISRMIG